MSASVLSFLLSLITAIVGILPFVFEKRSSDYKKPIFRIFIIYLIIAFLLFYAALPSLAYPMLGVVFLIGVLFSGITIIIMLANVNESIHKGWVVTVLGVVILFITSGSGCSMLRDESYASLIGDMESKDMVHWSNDIQPLDPTHIRLVPRELAITLAKTALSINGSTLGSQFPLADDYITLQRIKEEYFYLIPLDYEGYSVWTDTDYIPGYIKISATDPYAKPEMITSQKIKYTPGAWFYDNLERILWKDYNDKILTDYSFEEDDNGKVWWVITVCVPTISYWGDKVEGIILFDPTNGDNKFISLNDINAEEYKWIDRVYPEALIENYVSYWGSLKNGWLNRIWSKLNLLEPETPTMNYSSDGQCIIVQPITSTNNGDQSMTGLMYTNARTGKSVYYTISGGATEESVIEAVNSAVYYKMWHASEQIVYENIYGKMSSIVPILSENGKNYMGVAIVENENKRVAIGVTPQEALMEYKRLISSNGGQITTESLENTKTLLAKIERIGWETNSTSKQCYVTIDKINGKSFYVSSNVQSELALTNPGDSVKLIFVESDENPLTVITFKNLSLGLKLSNNQLKIDSTMVERNSK